METQIENKRGNPNLGASHRSRRDDSVKLLRMDIIAPLFKRGYTYRELREEVMNKLGLKTYSISTVKHDIEALLTEWRETRIENTDLAVQLELQRIDDLVREAWAAWEKSKESYTRKKMKKKGSPGYGSDGSEGSNIKVNSIEQTGEEVNSVGDPRFIDTINKLLIERRKLLGLYAPEKKEVSAGLSFADFLMKTGQKKREQP